MLCLGVLNKVDALNLKSKSLLNHKHFAYSFLKSIRYCAGIILPFYGSIIFACVLSILCEIIQN